jgi:hypothetical protein
LHSLKVLESDLNDDPFDEGGFDAIKKLKEKRDDESDEEEREDRQYRWKINRK